jgi:small subunit ribosomal protein S6
MAQGYETLIIAHPDIPDDDAQSVIDKVKDALVRSGAECIKVDNWGKRRLVYRIKGQAKGCFILVYSLGSPKTLKEIDLVLRYNEQVLRYQTMKTHRKLDLDTLRVTEPSEKPRPEEPVPERAVQASETVTEGTSAGETKEEVPA